MKYLCNNKVLFPALLLGNAVFFVIMAWVLNFQFEENDDVIMCLIANGNYTGTPDYHLAFQNVIWGGLVSSLYKLTNAIEWYSLLFSIIHVLSMSIIVYHVIDHCKDNKLLLISFLICIYSIWAVTIQSFQFTTTAGILCIAGFVQLREDSYVSIVSGIIAILIASLIRIQAAGLVGLVFFPLLILTYRQQWKKYLKLLILLLLILSVKTIDERFYSSREWRDWREYNNLCTVFDNPNNKSIQKESIESMGVHYEDYEMLCAFMPDPQVLTLPIMRQIYQCVDDVPLNVKVKNIQQIYKYRIPLLCLCLLTLFIVLGTKSRFDKSIILLWFLWLMLLVGCICLVRAPKNRVFLCALMTTIVGYSFLLNREAKSWLPIAISICVLGIAGKYTYQCYKVNDVRVEKSAIWNEQKTLIDQIPENAYLATFSCVPLEGMSPYRIKDFRVRVYPTGWLTINPLCKELGYSHREFVNPNVYIFVSNKTNNIIIADYLRNRYKMHISTEVIAKNDKYSIIQLQNTDL